MNHPLMTVLYQRVASQIEGVLIHLREWLAVQKDLNKLRKELLEKHIEEQALDLEIKNLTKAKLLRQIALLDRDL